MKVDDREGAILRQMMCVCGKPCMSRRGGPEPDLIPLMVTEGEIVVLNSWKLGNIFDVAILECLY